jgi:hypothetical protein
MASQAIKRNIPASFKETSMVIDILGRWAAAMGGAIGHARGVAQGAAYSAYAAPHTVYTSSPPTPCECKRD